MANDSNYQCSNCRAKLLLKHQTEPKKRREEAFCPYCMVNLPPRQGGDLLLYTLVEPPAQTAKRPGDPNQLGKLIIDIATGQMEDRPPTPEEQGKDPAAVALGRKGGLKGGKARAAKLTPSQRSQSAKKAAKSRW
jgi:DNA-directed RNA polymerase subunit RPC12/RpoP